jgi:hypothetical protein
MEPAINPPKLIDDPSDSKPSDWVSPPWLDSSAVCPKWAHRA